MRAADVLVLGGGPGGATVAALAAEAGANVLVLERDRFPRDKVCGEFLAPEGCRVLDHLGVLDRLLSRGAVWMDKFRMTDPARRSVQAPLPDLGPAGRHALGVSRAVLDTVLLEHARSCGAAVRERCRATAPIVRDGRVVGARYRDDEAGGAERSATAPIVVAADGRRSILVRALHPGKGDPTRSRPDTWFGLKTHLSGRSGRLERTVELHLFEGGYLGLSHVEGDRINLALVVTVSVLRAHGGSPQRLLEETLVSNPAVAEIVAHHPASGPWKSVGPLRFGARKPTAAGALFVGDAAGTVDPFCGEGMAHALTAAELAAPHVLEAAHTGKLSEKVARAYSRRWTRAFGSVTRRNRLLGRMLEHPALARVSLGLLSRGPDWIVPALVRTTRTGGRALSPIVGDLP